MGIAADLLSTLDRTQPEQMARPAGRRVVLQNTPSTDHSKGRFPEGRDFQRATSALTAVTAATSALDRAEPTGDPPCASLSQRPQAPSARGLSSSRLMSCRQRLSRRRTRLSALHEVG